MPRGIQPINTAIPSGTGWLGSSNKAIGPIVPARQPSTITGFRPIVESSIMAMHHVLGDQGTASVFDAMVLDEEGHADWFESQLQAIKAVGMAGYLAQQVEAGSGPA